MSQTSQKTRKERINQMKPLFEDVCENEYGHWARICDEHSRIPEIKYLGSMECEYNCSAGALCDILGCRNTADFYIDFYHWDESLRATKDSLAMHCPSPSFVFTSHKQEFK